MENRKIKIIPYLSFRGHCEEAVNTYIRAFGGEVHYMSCRSEDTREAERRHREKITYMEFTIGNVRMAAGDHFENTETTTDIMLMIHVESEEEALSAIDILGEGGIVLSPLHRGQGIDADDSDAVLFDRFGVMWIITCPKLTK